MLHAATMRCARSAHAIFRFRHPGAGCYRVGPVLLPSCDPTQLLPGQKPCKSVRTFRSSRAAKRMLLAAFRGGSYLRRLVGETGFEPATARPPAGCATRLRHSPWLQAGDGNRTRPRSLEGFCATTTLRPHHAPILPGPSPPATLAGRACALAPGAVRPSPRPLMVCACPTGPWPCCPGSRSVTICCGTGR
jgi:hypothetical protein